MDFCEQLVLQAQEHFDAVMPKPKTHFDPEITLVTPLPFDLLADITWAQLFGDSSVKAEHDKDG